MKTKTIGLFEEGVALALTPFVAALRLLSDTSEEAEKETEKKDEEQYWKEYGWV